jgi:hypothetical protein
LEEELEEVDYTQDRDEFEDGIHIWDSGEVASEGLRQQRNRHGGREEVVRTSNEMIATNSIILRELDMWLSDDRHVPESLTPITHTCTFAPTRA